MSDQVPEMFVPALLDASRLLTGDIIHVEPGAPISVADHTHATVAAYTIPYGKAGKYLIIGSIGWDYNVVGARGTKIAINGTFMSNAYGMAITDIHNAGPVPVTALLRYLKQGDLIELVALQNSGGNLDAIVSEEVTKLEIIRLGA